MPVVRVGFGLSVAGALDPSPLSSLVIEWEQRRQPRGIEPLFRAAEGDDIGWGLAALGGGGGKCLGAGVSGRETPEGMKRS